jgi:hypothetical protein
MLLPDPVMVMDSEALAVALSHEFPSHADADAWMIESPSISYPRRTDSQSARLLAQMRTLQRLDATPSTSRRRLELLV